MKITITDFYNIYVNEQRIASPYFNVQEGILQWVTKDGKLYSSIDDLVKRYFVGVVDSITENEIFVSLSKPVVITDNKVFIEDYEFLIVRNWDLSTGFQELKMGKRFNASNVGDLIRECGFICDMHEKLFYYR